MHDVTEFGVAAKNIGDNLAEGLGEETLINVFDS